MNRQPIDGFLNVRKPKGPTSSRIVEQIRRWSKADRVGHGGTLDPEADGVLPIGLGYGTRLIEFIPEPKVYRAEVLLGVETDTYDQAGTVLSTRDTSGIDRAMVEAACAGFVGDIQQRPPAFSALKREGQPLYKLARQGVIVEVEPRPVHIEAIEVQAWESSVATLLVTCGKGTYIRSLAHDIGEVLGCGGSLQALTRTQVGGFTIEGSVSIDDVRLAFDEGHGGLLLYPIDFVVRHWQAVSLDDAQAMCAVQGKGIEVAGVASLGAIERYAAYHEDRLLALLEPLPESSLWHPFKVFPARK